MELVIGVKRARTPLAGFIPVPSRVGAARVPGPAVEGRSAAMYVVSGVSDPNQDWT